MDGEDDYYDGDNGVDWMTMVKLLHEFLFNKMMNGKVEGLKTGSEKKGWGGEKRDHWLFVKRQKRKIKNGERWE